MKARHTHTKDSGTPDAHTRHRHISPGWRILKWTGITAAALATGFVAVVCIATWWLTPDRLTRIINERASRELNADVHAGNVRFSLWSTFPHLCLEADSLYVRSRNFDTLSPRLRHALPGNADFLLATRHLRGGINLLKLLGGEIWLGDVSVDSLRVNLVALSDSLNNYDIAHGPDRVRMPRLRIGGIHIANRGSIHYTSLVSRTSVHMDLAGASLMPRDGRDRYHLALSGSVSARSDSLDILHDFPLRLDGNVDIRFRPFGISTSDYRVGLGQVEGRLSLDMDLGRNMTLNNFGYRMENFSLQDIAPLLPPGQFTPLRRLDADLDLNLSARLTTPYDFASAYLPSIRVDCSVPDGEVSYTFSDGTRYTMRRVALQGCFVFDGRHPDRSYIDIPDFHAEGLGADVDIAARVTHLTSLPHVSARLQGGADLSAVGRNISDLMPFHPEGNLDIDAAIQFDVAGRTLTGTRLDVSARADRLAFSHDSCFVDMRGFTARSSESLPRVSDGSTSLNDIPLTVSASAQSLRIGLQGGSLDLRDGTLTISSLLCRAGAEPYIRRAGLSLRGDTLRVSAGKTRTAANGVALDMLACRINTPHPDLTFRTPASWHADSVTMASAPHSPQFIHISAPASVRRLMDRWSVGLNLRIAGADVKNPGLPDGSRLDDIDISASTDSLSVRNVTFSSGVTGGHAAVRVGNLRQFLTSPVPAPLPLAIDLDLDTVQINELARAYTLSHPGSAISLDDKVAMAAGTDTVALIIPRNLYADIRATARQTRYINLHLHDLMTHVRLGDGRADVDTLHISSDFGQTALKFTYDTSDLQQMAMKAAMRIYDIDVVSFFNNFHSLLLMMPEMKNLSGNISASIEGDTRIFPKMYVMVPSLRADMRIYGSDLKLHQNRFIRHVTRMLMLPGTDDLHIADMKIHAAVHNNLVEVFPFTFEMSRYRLSLCGLNNFGGDMYYHISVEDWPLRLPFGINIRGHFHKPELRFGGKDWKDRNGALITERIQDYDSFNLVRVMRRYAGEFIHTAAAYRGE